MNLFSEFSLKTLYTIHIEHEKRRDEFSFLHEFDLGHNPYQPAEDGVKDSPVIGQHNAGFEVPPWGYES